MADSRNIKFRHLQCFLAVAESGSLQKAADRLAITQPAVSKTLKELEALLAVKLFERGRRGAVLTADGSAFLRHAGASVSALRDAVASVAPASNRAAPIVSLGVLPTVAPCIALPLLQALGAAGSPIRLRIHTGSNPELLARLRQRELDLVIGRFAEPAQMAGLSFEHLYADPLVLAVRPGHTLLASSHASSPARNRDPLAALAGFTLLLPLPDTAIRQSADSFLAARGMVGTLRTVETLSVDLARSYVASSDAVWITPLGAVESLLLTGEMARLAVDTAGTEELVGLSLRADMQPNPAQADVLGCVRAIARNCARPGPRLADRP
jgi:LysR family transcriptional regulator, pca operon transcriptional activator